MRNILSGEGAAALREIAHDHPLLVFDFDGTLAPIVPARAEASMRETTWHLLRLVSLLYPCAVLSGRARADVLARVAGVPLLAVVGNHGAEAGYGPVDRSLRARVEEWLRRARPLAAGFPGVELEDKGFSVAIHYRAARARGPARRAVLALARDLPDARVIGGRAVVNVVPADAHDKGAAVASLLPRACRARAVYVGDDATDEDAFASASVACAVRVGRTRRSAAGYYVPSQAHVDELLRALVRARRRAEGLGERIDGLERVARACAEGPRTR